jgi:hypothetical protein
MIPSLGGIGFFKGKLIKLCGRLTQISMSTHGTSTKEDFEVVKFIENNAPFSMLLGKPWIEKRSGLKERRRILREEEARIKRFHN